MGKTATHAVVMARLFTAGKEYGPHPFIVQIRSNEVGRSLPGVQCNASFLLTLYSLKEPSAFNHPCEPGRRVRILLST